jgi:DNA-binding GntR family transcriptional regulator
LETIAALSEDDRKEEKTLAEKAYRLLRVDIIHGVRKPGEHLKVAALKAEYKLGIAPIREALQRLSSDSLVVPQGQKGFIVAPLTLEELWGLTEARTCLELRALQLSIEKGDDRWEAGIVAAAYRLEKFDHMLMNGEPCLAEWEERNCEFHRTILNACGVPWIMRLRDLLYDLHVRYRHVAVGGGRSNRDLAREHTDIRDAVLARDLPRAQKLLEEHILAAARGFEALMKKTGD